MRSKSKRQPLYKQIRTYIVDNISQNRWKPNDKIPSENELAAQFHVSRITIKNALQELTNEGVIYRIQGKGSFVSKHESGETPVYQSDSGQDSNLVAYLMPRLDNLFTANLLNGIENQLALEGYHLLFCETNGSQERESEILKKMIQLKVKGIIIYPVTRETYNEELLKLTLNNFPLVVVDRYIKGVETNCVCSDNFNSGYEAVTHLLQLGHSRIGFVTTPYEGTTSKEDRISGYEKAIIDNHIPIDHSLRLIYRDAGQPAVKTSGQEPLNRSMIESIKSFFLQNPDMTSVIAVNSGVGFNVLEAAKELSVQVPEDVSVVFLDDFEFSSFSAIPPTCVSQEEKNVGREAAKLLVSIIENPKQGRRKINTPTKLIVRKSTAPVNVRTNH